MNTRTKLIVAAFLMGIGTVHCGKASLNGATDGSGNQPPEQPATPGQPTTSPCTPGTAEEIDFTQPGDGVVTSLPVDPTQVARVISVSVDGKPVAFTYDADSGTVDLTVADAGRAGSAITIDACAPASGGTAPGGSCGGKPCGKPSPKPSPTA